MRDRDPSRPDPVSDLDELLWNLAQRYCREVLAVYEQHDLTGADALLVEALAQGADTPKALAQALDYAAPYVSTILKRLEARRLTVRTQNPRDARSVQITFTPAGRELVATVKQNRQARLETILTDVPAEEQERLQHYLVWLTDVITATAGSPKASNPCAQTSDDDDEEKRL